MPNLHTWPRFRFRQERFTGHGYYLYNRTVLPKVRRYLCLLACRNDLGLVPCRCVVLAARPLAWHNCQVTVTVLMTASNEARIRVIIVADDRTTRKVSGLLRQLDIRWKIADRPEWPESRTDGVLHCFTVKSVPVPLFPLAIVITNGEFVSDRVVQAVATRGISAIAFEDLSNQALLHAIVRSTLGVSLEAVARRVPRDTTAISEALRYLGSSHDI